MNYDAAMIGRLLRREGGSRVSTHTRDRGGVTKYGITKAALSSWRGYAVSDADVIDLTEAEARELYAHVYLKPFAIVPDLELRELLFDCAVLHGIGRAKRWLQDALDGEDDGQDNDSVATDGRWGPQTRAALAVADHADLTRRVLRLRLRFVGRVITDRPDQAAFAAGWCDRIAGFIV